MPVALKLNSATGHLEQFDGGEALLIDAIDRLSGSGDMSIGASLGAPDTLELGSAASLVEVLGDLQVDGALAAQLDAGSQDIINVDTLRYDTQLDNGNSGASQTVTWANGQKQRTELNNANPTITHTFPSGPANYIWIVEQDATTVATAMTLAVTGGVARFPQGSLRIGAAAGSLTIVAIYYDGTNAWFTSAPGMTTGSVSFV